MFNAMYQIGLCTTVSGFRALELQRSEKADIRLHLDNRFDYFDWLGYEGTLDIQTLEDQQVQRINGLNKPIRLMYSGGTDSYSIAHAFGRAKIPVVYTMIEFGTLRNGYLDSAAMTGFKIKLLEALHNRYGLPPPKIEILSVDDNLLNWYFINQSIQTQAYYPVNKTFNANNMALLLEFSKYKPDAYVNVFGVEKPRLYEDDKGIYWQVTDTMTMYGEHANYETVWFYLDKHCPELVLAQCQGVLRLVDKLALRDSSRYRDILRSLQTSPDSYHQWCEALGRQTTLWISFNSKVSKVKPGEQSGLVDDPRYKHYDHCRSTNTAAYKAYTNFYNHVKDLTGADVLPDISSDRFYITRK